MSVAAVVSAVAEGVVRVADKTPEAEDVKAGWTAFVLFLLLIAAVVFLAFSFLKQLRKAQAAKDAGVYGDDEPTPPGAGADAVADGEASSGDADGSTDGAATSEPENHSTP